MAKRVVIKFHKNPVLTEIHDADTGEMLTNVFRLELVVVDVNNGVFEVKLAELEEGQELAEIEGEIEATVTEKFMLSEAVMDSLARHVEKRIVQRMRLSAGRGGRVKVALE